MENARCVAVDWSGRANESGQLANIWVAEAVRNDLIRLRSGLTRDEVTEWLVELVRAGEPVIIGLDFAFSFPQWYLEHRQLGGGTRALGPSRTRGRGVAERQYLSLLGPAGQVQENPGMTCGDDPNSGKQTKTDRVFDQCPFSRFMEGEQSAQGPSAACRHSPRLRDAGAAIWPFNDANPGRATVVEIYPRLFYGMRLTNNGSVQGRNHRANFLEERYPHLGQHWKDAMTGNDNAFDAGVSALAMSQHAGELCRLQGAAEPPYSVEGDIWPPRNLVNPETGIFPPR